MDPNNQYIQYIKQLAQIDQNYSVVLNSILNVFGTETTTGKKYTLQNPYVPYDVVESAILPDILRYEVTGGLSSMTSSQSPYYPPKYVDVLINHKKHAATNLVASQAALALLNPRFDQQPNPLYYFYLNNNPANLIQDSNTDVNNDSFVGELFDSRNDITQSSDAYQDYKGLMQSNLTILNSMQYSYFDDAINILNSPEMNAIEPPPITNYNIFLQSNDGQNTIYKYDDLYKHVGNTDFKTYWDSVIPTVKSRITTLISTADNILNQDLGQSGLFIDSIVKNTTGIDFYTLKENAIYNLEVNNNLFTNGDSEDTLYGSIKGMIIGQEEGNNFKTAIPGFQNSNNTPVNNGWNIEKEISSWFNKTNNNLPPDVEDRAQWYLPNSNPALYPFDYRMLFTSGSVPTKHDIATLFTDIQNNFLTQGSLTKTLTKVATDASNTLNNLVGSIASIGSTLIGQGGNKGPLAILGGTPNTFENTYFERFNPDSIEQQNGMTFWERALSVVLAGGNNSDEVMPLVPLQGHADYVTNTPMAQTGKWFIVDKQWEVEQAGNYYSNFAIKQITSEFPNIKSVSINKITSIKSLYFDDNIPREGVQQADGSYDNYSYSGYDSNGAPLLPPLSLNDSTFLSNTTNRNISDAIDGSGINYGKTIKTYDDNSYLNESQYFPFYIRTISRDENVFLQQPIYNNGLVVMSKRKISGNSIVFFDANVENITESFSSPNLTEQFLGRTEPVLIYNGTTRSFSFEFTLPANSPSDIPSIRSKTNEIIRMLYPQVQAVEETGIIAFRRGPIVEIRIGDQWILYGMISSLTLTHGLDAKVWETLPGMRVLKGCKFQVQLSVVHAEMPNATTDFYSPSFRDTMSYPTPAQTQNNNVTQNNLNVPVIQSIGNFINSI